MMTSCHPPHPPTCPPTSCPSRPPTLQSTVDTATILALDSLGMMVAVQRGQDQFKIRLPFPRPATDRKSIKELIVEMTRASADALPVPAAPPGAAAAAAAAQG